MNVLQFLWEGVRFAFHAISTNRMRSFLTMLGVATGIFAITGILTMVNSLQTSLTENLASLGNTTLFVHHWPWKDNSQDWYKFMNRPKASYKDYAKLKQHLRYAEGVAYEATVMNQTAKRDGRSVGGIGIVGMTEDAGILRNWEFAGGRFFSEMENHLASSVCIIGHNISQNLFPNAPDPTGKYIQVSGNRLKVVGVMKRKGGAMFGPGSEDDAVMIPYRTLAGMYNLNSRFVEKVITIKAVNHDMLGYVEEEVRGIVRAARGLKPKVEDNFAINKQESVIEQFDQLFGVLDTGGWIISIFSILIGGFSIGMIMYISVRERTNEIGIQKALGSVRSFILYQFLMESLLICLSGGLIGLACTFGVGQLSQFLMDQSGIELTVSFATGDILTGIGLSAFIGLVSGIMPAGIAASLDPVIAIRHS